MSKNPSDTWFYNDWENDPELKSCSLAAQGLWMRLLCIAARSPERGVVQIGSLDFSHPNGLQQIAAAVGRSQEEIAPLIDELVSSRAASLDRKKRITNRRMVRAAKTSKARSRSGKNGADVTNGKRWKKTDLGRQNVGKNVSKTSPSSSLPSSFPPDHVETPEGESLSDEPIDPAREPARSGQARKSNLPPFLRRQPERVASLIEPNFQPEPETREAALAARTDMTEADIDRRHGEFLTWCAEKAVTSHNFDATWYAFMVKTHAKRTSNGRQHAADEENPTLAGIRESLARRHLLPGG